MANRARDEGKQPEGFDLQWANGGKKTHIGDVVTSKRNQATQCPDHFRGGPRGISTGGDEHVIAPNLPKEPVRVRAVVDVLADTGDTRFDGMEVGEIREPPPGRPSRRRPVSDPSPSFHAKDSKGRRGMQLGLRQRSW